MLEQYEMYEILFIIEYVDISFNYVCAIVHNFSNMYGAVDVIL